jgi:hypothetical protein
VYFLPRLTSNLDASDLCLLRSQDYRCEPQAPGFNWDFKSSYGIRHAFTDLYFIILGTQRRATKKEARH